MTNEINTPIDITKFQMQMAQISYSSPLPPPEILGKYEQAKSGLIDEIIQLTKLESAHRHGIENKDIEAQINSAKQRDSETRYGQWFAFIISIISIIGCVFLGLSGHDNPAIALGIVSLTPLATRFINGRNEENK